jgi:hypothetical protein
MKTPAPNSTYKKLAVQYLNKALCFESSVVLNNPPERKAPKHCKQPFTVMHKNQQKTE